MKLGRARSRTQAGAAAAAAALLGLGGCAPEATGPAVRPPVVLVVFDTLRPDRLGAYGHPADTSPRIDAFAREALLFERCFSHSPSTRPSMGSVLTGFLPHETGVLEGGPLPAEVDTLAEILRREGYATAAVVSNYVLRRELGYDQGFDVYDHELERRGPGDGVLERTAPDTTDRAIAVLERLAKRPFFLWVHYQDPHGPYVPPPPLDRRFRDPTRPAEPLPVHRTLSGRGAIPVHQALPHTRDRLDYVAAYDGEIRYADAQFGRLVAALRRLGLWDRALVVLTADHGESLGERGFHFSHVGQLHFPLPNVPLLLRHGDALRGRSDAPCQHVDLVPTVLAALGLPADPRLRGRDLRREPEGPVDIVAATRSPIDRDGRKWMLVSDAWKLVETEGAPPRLHHLASDPREERDLAGDPARAERIERLSARLGALRAEDRLGLGGRAAPELGEEELRNLRALGYVE